MADEIKITDAAVDPKWSWGRMTEGNIPFIVLHHPRMGDIQVLVFEKTLDQIITGLVALKGRPH